MFRKVDVRLHEKGNSNSHGSRPVHLIITMIKWIRTIRLLIKNSLMDLRIEVYPAGGGKHSKKSSVKKKMQNTQRITWSSGIAGPGREESGARRCFDVVSWSSGRIVV